jgi:hypothetical protein
LNKIDDDNNKKWRSHHDNWQPNSVEFETVKPFVWYSKNVLQQMRDIAPNAIPSSGKDEDSDEEGHDYSINYKVETVHLR